MWRVDTEVGRNKVLICGPLGRYKFEVMKGAITKQVMFALRAIQQPAMRRSLDGDWKVTCPKRYNGLDNSGERRRILCLSPPKRATVVLRLLGQGNWLSEEFLRAVRDVVQRQIDPGTTNEQIRSKAKEYGRRGGLANRRSVA